jgi:hypothetical protein
MEEPFLCHSVRTVLASNTAVTIQTIIIEVVGFNVSLIRAQYPKLAHVKSSFRQTFLHIFSLNALVCQFRGDTKDAHSDYEI